MAVAAASTVVFLALSGCGQKDYRSDIVVYGDHVPALDNSGQPFSEIFTAQADTSFPITRTALRVAPGLSTPVGAGVWSVEAWAKYAFLGNYDKQGGGTDQHIEDQKLGVFDSETHAFCNLDLDPTKLANASLEWLDVANPRARKTRLFFEGIAAQGSGGFPFGFVRLDLDLPDACNPTTGWTTKGFLPAELNAAAAASNQPPVCPDQNPADPADDWCGFDGMTLLRHDDATNTDTVVLANWMGNREVIAEIDGNEQLRIPAVHVLPVWQPEEDTANPDPNVDACYRLFPVGPPAVDSTRPANDLRFVQAFDKVCALPDTPGCPTKSICPISNTSCNGSCADAYCPLQIFGYYFRSPPPDLVKCGDETQAKPASCSRYPFLDRATRKFKCFDFGQATNACVTTHVNTSCKLADDNKSAFCGCAAPSTPIQEFGYDASTRRLRATSSLFQSAVNHTMIDSRNGYSKTGDLFLTAGVNFADGHWESQLLRYPLSGGEHAFFQAGARLDDGRSRIVPAPVSRPYPLKTSWFSLPGATAEVGNAMYIASKDSLQRDLFGFGNWAEDSNYKISFGVGTPATPLPHEAFTCAPTAITSCSSDADCQLGYVCLDHQHYCNPAEPTACRTDAECASGELCALKRCLGTWVPSMKPCQSDTECPAPETCRSGGGLGEVGPGNIELGGAPASLWMAPHHGTPPGKLGRANAYLTRIPVAVDLPGDNTTGVAPALAWSSPPSCTSFRCQRLWLFGNGSTGLRYRTRDQGLWSDSYRPLPANVTLAGGVSAVFAATAADFSDARVELFGRGSNDGKLYASRLTSPSDCAGAACTWASWTAVPGSPVTDVEPATAFAILSQQPVLFLAAKDRNGQLWVAQRSGATWSSFRAIPGVTSDAAPSLVFKGDDAQVWLFVRDRQNGAIKYARVDSGSPSWTTAGNAGAVLPWTTGPTAAFTGIMRVLVGSGSFPSLTYQATFSDGAWDDWKPTITRAGSTRPPAAANVNGDLNVVTTWLNLQAEQLVK